MVAPPAGNVRVSRSAAGWMSQTGLTKALHPAKSFCDPSRRCRSTHQTLCAIIICLNLSVSHKGPGTRSIATPAPSLFFSPHLPLPAVLRDMILCHSPGKRSSPLTTCKASQSRRVVSRWGRMICMKERRTWCLQSDRLTSDA